MPKCISAAEDVLFSEHIGRSTLSSCACATMCGDLLNLGLSTIAKRQKGFYLATLHVGAQMGFAFWNASSTGKQERTFSSTSFAPYHKGFLWQIFTCAALRMSSKLCFIEFEQEMSREE